MVYAVMQVEAEQRRSEGDVLQRDSLVCSSPSFVPVLVSAFGTMPVDLHDSVAVDAFICCVKTHELSSLCRSYSVEGEPVSFRCEVKDVEFTLFPLGTPIITFKVRIHFEGAHSILNYLKIFPRSISQYTQLEWLDNGEQKITLSQIRAQLVCIVSPSR